MFKKGRLYRHMSTLDIDMFINVVVEKTAGGDIVDVKYYNRRYKVFQPDALSSEVVVIKKEDFDKWEEIYV